MVCIANGFVKILTEILEDDEDNFIESIKKSHEVHFQLDKNINK